MKYLLSIILLLSISFNVFAQYTKVTSASDVNVNVITGIPNVKPYCIGESETHLVFSSYIDFFNHYVVAKNNLDISTNYSTKKTLENNNWFEEIYKDGKLVVFQVDRIGEKGVNYFLTDAFTGEVIESKRYSLADKFKIINGHSILFSPDKTKVLLKLRGRFVNTPETKEKEEEDFAYLVFDNTFKLLYSNFLTQKSSYIFSGFIDDNGSIYEWVNSNFNIFDANKEYEKWSEKISLKSREELYGTVSILPPVQLENGDIIFSGNYAKGIFDKDLYKKDFPINAIIIKVDYLTKEISNTSINKDDFFGQIPGGMEMTSYIRSLKKNQFISFSTFNKYSTIYNLFNENLKKKYRNVINGSKVSNVSSAAANYRGNAFAVNYETEKLFYLFNINTITGYNSKTQTISDNYDKKMFKSLKEMGAVLFSIDIDTDIIKSTRLIFSPEDGKKYKKYVYPRSAYFSTLSNDLYLVLQKLK